MSYIPGRQGILYFISFAGMSHCCGLCFSLRVYSSHSSSDMRSLTGSLIHTNHSDVCMLQNSLFSINRLSIHTFPANTNICIKFIQSWANIEDARPTLYKCYTKFCASWESGYANGVHLCAIWENTALVQ